MSNPNFEAIAARAVLTFEPFPEDTPVSECYACGDTDPETLAWEAGMNNALADRIEAGDPWAWCVVKMTARSAGGVKADHYIGCCSYASEEDFLADGYEDMAAEAREALAVELERVFLADFSVEKDLEQFANELD